MDNEQKNPGQVTDFDANARSLAAGIGGGRPLAGADMSAERSRQLEAQRNEMTAMPVTIGSMLNNLTDGMENLDTAIDEIYNKLGPLLLDANPCEAELGGKPYEPNSEIINRLQTLINKVDIAVNRLVNLKNTVQI